MQIFHSDSDFSFEFQHKIHPRRLSKIIILLKGKKIRWKEIAQIFVKIRENIEKNCDESDF